MAQEVYQHVFPNGMTLLAERMEHVRSAAVNFMVPAGCVFDPADRLGLAALVADMITRGAGDRDSRALSEAMDAIGLDRSEGVLLTHMRFWGATLATHLPAALSLYADVLRRPLLPEDELEACQSLALQDIQGIEDEPRQKLFIELRRRHLPPPYSNDRRGTEGCVESITIDDVRAFHARGFSPAGTILSVAGNIDWPALRDQVERLFGDWKGEKRPEPVPGPVPGGCGHIQKETAQTQIGLAYPSVPIGSDDYYSALGAVNVLSGGMSARLFTEVREKRGLCYSVSASYSTLKDRASIFCYAGTTPERAQETLDVTLHELKRLADGIEEEEVERVRAGLKSSLIMQEESTSSRAGSLASDWYYLGRVRSSEELRAAIDGLTPAGIMEHLRRCPPREFTIETLGPQPLQIKD